MESRFSLTSQECEILLEFEQAGSLLKLAENLGKDISVVSRNLKSIGESSSVLEKKKGRWCLTKMGHDLNDWTRESILSQKLLLNSKKSFVIASTREFASRILIPSSRDLMDEENMSISIISTDQGIENLILSGKADFGFDCSRPISKKIAYRRIAREPFSVVASPNFIKRLKIKSFDDLAEHDRLNFSRNANSLLDTDIEETRLNATFNDISILRSACVEGFGWAVLPAYAVKEEVINKKLKIISGAKIEDERMGIWWPAERKSLLPWIEKASVWLKSQEHRF